MSTETYDYTNLGWKGVQYNQPVFEALEHQLFVELGAEIDGGGLTLSDIETKQNSLDLLLNYHCMNDGGYYDGYIHVKVSIPVFSPPRCSARFLVFDYATIQMTYGGSTKRAKYYTGGEDYYYESAIMGVQRFFQAHYINHRTGEIVERSVQ